MSKLKSIRAKLLERGRSLVIENKLKKEKKEEDTDKEVKSNEIDPLNYINNKTKEIVPENMREYLKLDDLDYYSPEKEQKTINLTTIDNEENESNTNGEIREKDLGKKEKQNKI